MYITPLGYTMRSMLFAVMDVTPDYEGAEYCTPSEVLNAGTVNETICPERGFYCPDDPYFISCFGVTGVQILELHPNLEHKHAPTSLWAFVDGLNQLLSITGMTSISTSSPGSSGSLGRMMPARLGALNSRFTSSAVRLLSMSTRNLLLKPISMSSPW